MATPASILNIAVVANTASANTALAGTQARLRATAATSVKSTGIMKKAFVGLGVAAAGAAAGLYKIGEAFDDSYDTIRTQTGATGKEMVKLKRSFRDVVRSVPADFGTASKAVAGVSQRLDVTGRNLGRLSKQFSELARITETDVEGNIRSVSRAFGDWEVQTRKQSEQLDKFFRASQASGASVEELAEQVVQFGAPLRQVGFTLDEATAMFASFEKAGVNTQTMMPGLRMALKNFLLEDIDPRKGLLKAFQDIESGTMKSSDALTLFGQRAGADMIEAIQQGRFELDKMTRALAEGDSSIRKTGRETRDLAEHWQQFKNLLALELEPVAKRVFAGLSKLMKELSSTFRREGISGVFDLLLEKLTDALSKAVEVAAENGPKIAAALIKGFVNAGVWGAVAAGAIVWKLLGGIGAMRTAAAKAGTTMATSLGAGLKAGLGRAGIAAGIVAAIESIFTSGGIKDTLEGKGFSEIMGSKVGGEFAAKIGPALEQAISNKAIPQLRKLQEQIDRTIKGFEEMGMEVPQELRDMSQRAAAAMDRTSAKMGDLREDAQQLRRGFADSWGQIRGNLEENLRKIESSMGTHTKNGQRLVSQNFQAAVQSIKRAMREGYIGVERGGQLIEDLIRKRLNMMGIKGPDAEKIIRSSGGDSPGGLQRGGPAASLVPGAGTGDKIPAMLEPGEVVVNRKAVAAMGGANKVNQINKVIPRFAAGGVVEALGPVDMPPFRYDAAHAGGNRHLHLAMSSPSAIVAFGKRLQQAGYMVSEHPAFGGVGGMHAPGGYHYTNQAIDINTAADETVSEIRKVVAMLGGAVRGAVSGGGPVKLNLPRFKSPFAAFMPHAEQLNQYAAAAERVIGRRAGRREGAESGMNLSGSYQGNLNRVFPEHTLANTAGFTRLSAGQIDKLRAKAGLPPAFVGVAQRESNFYPGIVGHDPGGTQGLGLWQITTSFNDDVIARLGGRKQMFNPWKNAQAAKIIFDRQPSAWGASGGVYQKGGIAGFAKGAVVGPGGGTGSGSAPWAKVMETISRLRSRTPRIEEQIANAQTIDAMLSSPAGADLSEAERAGQIGLGQKLLTNLTGRASGIGKALKLLPKKDKRRKGLSGELVGLQGITGKGGTILQARAALDALMGSSAAGGMDWEQIAGLNAQLAQEANLRYAVSQAQYSTLGGFPSTTNPADVRITFYEGSREARVTVNGQDQNVRALVEQGSRRMGSRPLPGALGR